jgi:hypothetical protein
VDEEKENILRFGETDEAYGWLVTSRNGIT